MTNRTNQSPDSLTLGAFAAVLLIGGGNFLAVRFSNTELDPFWGAGLRFSVAALLFVALTVALGLEWPRGRALATIALYGVVTFTLSYALMYWALVQVTAGMGAVILAIVPLLTPLLAVVHKIETLHPRSILGATIAMIGIVWMTVSPEGLLVPLGGLLAILAAALTMSEGVILGKRVSESHPAVTNAVAMLAGAPLLLALSGIAGESWALPSQPRAIFAVIYLVTFGSVGLFILFLLVVRRWTASATSYAFVLFPVVTMLLESWLSDVPLTGRGIAAALVVMAGVWYGTISGPGATASSPGSLDVDRLQLD